MKNDLRLYAKGAAFEDGLYDLRSLEVVVTNYRRVLDRLIGIQMGLRQLPPQIRSGIDYKVQVNSGSVDLVTFFQLHGHELFTFLGPMASDGGYQLAGSIVKLFSAVIELRKIAAELMEKHVPFNIKIVNNIVLGSNNVIINGNSGEIQINDPKILWAAQTTMYPTDRLISAINGTNIEFIDLATEKEGIRLTPEHRNILGKEKEKLPTTMDIVGRLDLVAFSSHKGEIVSNHERFPVTWDDSIRQQMQRNADIEGIIFTVEPIIDRTRLHSEAISFHVINCKNPQKQLEY